MNFLKLISIILIFCSGFTYAQSDLDRYYSLEEEVAKLRAQFRDNQSLISETNTTSNHFWSPSSTKKILGRLHKDQDRILKEMEPKIKEMRRLEQTLEVKAWDYRFGTLEQVNTILGNVSQNNTCFAQGQQLFTSDKAFEAWNAQNGDLDRKVAYYAQKNGYISNCLENKKEGDNKTVSYRSKRLCKVIDWFPDETIGSGVNYKLIKKNGIININTSIYFDYKGEERHRKEAFRKLRETIPCMKDFYARHGIKLNLTIKEDSGFMDRMGCDHTVNLHSHSEIGNSYNWPTHEMTVNPNPELSAMNRCSLYLHELGHRLGLADTYSDPDCPDRDSINPPDDVMNYHWSGADNIKIYPSAIKTILGPICGE